MLYYLFDLLQQSGFPGARLMSYITFRSGAALVLSLIIAIFIGRRIIERLQKDAGRGGCEKSWAGRPDEEDRYTDDGRYYHHHFHIDTLPACEAIFQAYI